MWAKTENRFAQENEIFTYCSENNNFLNKKLGIIYTS